MIRQHLVTATVNAIIHFRSQAYDCMMFDQLLWETTDRVLAIERPIV